MVYLACFFSLVLGFFAGIYAETWLRNDMDKFRKENNLYGDAFGEDWD